MKPIRLTLWSVKGGVGKTSLALNFAFHFKCGIITNERYTMLDKVLPEDDFLKLPPEQNIPDIPNEYSIIFDMGGFLDKRVEEAVKQSDYVIIPTTCDKLDIQGTISTIGEIKNLTDNIIIVVNKSEKEEEFLKTAELFKEVGDYPIFEIKKSKAVKQLVDTKKSIIHSQEEGGLKGYILKSSADKFKELTNFITNKK